MTLEKFLIIDGNSIAYRAVSAKPKGMDELVNAKGVATGGLYRFINILNKTLELVKPTHIIIGFDTSGKTFRHEIDNQYKANRKNNQSKEDVYSQFDSIKCFLDLVGIKHDNVYLYEGDDIVGTYCKKSKAHRNYVLSGDKDIFQLINDNTSVIFPIKGVKEVEIYDKEKFASRFNVDVSQFIDYKTLLGDRGDNIFGLDGCGTKGTETLLKKFGSIENIYNNLESDCKDIRGWKSLREKIKEWDYEKPRKLVTIKTDVDVNFDYDDCKLILNWEKVVPFFIECEFNSFIKKIGDKKFYGQNRRLI